MQENWLDHANYVGVQAVLSGKCASMTYNSFRSCQVKCKLCCNMCETEGCYWKYVEHPKTLASELLGAEKEHGNNYCSFSIVLLDRHSPVYTWTWWMYENTLDSWMLVPSMLFWLFITSQQLNCWEARLQNPNVAASSQPIGPRFQVLGKLIGLSSPIMTACLQPKGQLVLGRRLQVSHVLTILEIIYFNGSIPPSNTRYELLALGEMAPPQEDQRERGRNFLWHWDSHCPRKIHNS